MSVPSIHARYEIFPFPIHQTVFPNGLRLAVVPLESPGVMAYFTVVRVGSRNELEPGNTGFAHFFEHMMFRGTQRYPEREYVRILQRLGASHNAWTSEDATVYNCVVTSQALRTLIEVEADRIQNLRYDTTGFEKEAGAILGEYNVGASDPMMKLYETLYDLAFTTHTYKHTVMGFLEDIQAMPDKYGYSLRFYNRYYRPENTILIVTGDVVPSQVESLVWENYGSWEKGGYSPSIPNEPPQEEERRKHIRWKAQTQNLMVIGYKKPGFSLSDLTLPALDLFSEIMFSKNSELYREVVIDKDWAQELEAQNELYRDPNLFLIVLRCNSKEGRDKAEEAIYTSLEKAKKELIPAEKLERSRSHIRKRIILGMESLSGVAYWLSLFANLTGDPALINRYYSLYDDVTPEEIRRVVQEIFEERRRTVVTLSYEGGQ